MKREESYGSSKPEKFSVRPDAFTPFIQDLRELAPQAAEAKTYAATWTELDPSGGSLMERVVDCLYTIDTEVIGYFESLHSATDGAADELQRARRLYRTLDHEAAARIDSTYWSAP